MITKRRKRRWYQFSLRTLLLLVVLAAIGLGLVASWAQRERSREMAVEKLEALGAEVRYEEEEEQVIERWARNLFGLDHGVVVWVDLSASQVTDAGLEHLKGLTNLGVLDLVATQVSDAGLEHLKGLTSLWGLDLSSTQVTDEDVRKLEAVLPGCQITH
jgi:hypothetical protein